MAEEGQSALRSPASSSAPRSTSPAASKANSNKAALLRYAISAREYELLHRYLLSRNSSRSPGSIATAATAAATGLKKRLPTTSQYEAALASKDDYVPATVRASLRIFLATRAGLKIWEVLKTRVLPRDSANAPKTKSSTPRSPDFRLALSLSTIFLFHRLLYRFFTLLRTNLLAADARPFRVRNPRTSRLLVSKLAPAVGASLAGFMLGLYPADQLRMTIAIYALSRAGEFAWNKAEGDGWFKERPWWFGSWMLFPVASGQLLHAFIFDRDCFPQTFGDLILKHSGNYIQRRPEGYLANIQWPDTYEIVDNLATVAKMKYPPFISPILFPNSKTLPSALSATAPVIDPAHPAIKSLTCAMLHPNDPSCLRSYITYWIQTFPGLARFVTILFTALALPRYHKFLHNPVVSIDKLARSILKMSTFFTGAIGTSWAMICFFQQLLPRTFLPTQRFFLGGFVGGLWAFLERKSGRGQFLYSARLSIDSAWKVGVKRGWVRGFSNGDVWLFVACLAVFNVVHERNPMAINSSVVRRVLNGARGVGFVDDDVQGDDMQKETVEEEQGDEAQ